MGEIEQKFNILKKLIVELSPEFVEQVKQELTETEKQILKHTLPYYKQAGRFYDMWHIPLSTRFMSDLCKNRNLNRNTFIPTIILHDSGYAKIVGNNPNLAKGNWNADTRIAHMHYGQEIAQELFNKYKFNLTNEEKQQIKAIIATHDNPYINKPLIEENEKIHRDADRIYVLSFTSFVKDFLRYKEKNKNTTPEGFLRSRICFFFNKEECEKLDIDVTLKPTKEDFEKYKIRYEPMYSKLGRERNIVQLKARIEDIKNNIFTMGLQEFEVYCRKYMIEERNKKKWRKMK